MRSLMSRNVTAPDLIFTGLPPPVFRFRTSSSLSRLDDGDGGHAALEEAI